MKSLNILVCLVCLASFARGEQMTLTNQKADELLGALLSLDAGLSAVNTTLAADNINELRPKVTAYGKGTQAAAKRHNLVAGMKTDDPAYVAYLAEYEANQNAEIQVDLARMTITDEELVAAKIKPSILSVIRQTLKPAAAAPAPAKK